MVVLRLCHFPMVFLCKAIFHVFQAETLQDVLAYLLERLPEGAAQVRNFGAISAGAAISGHMQLDGKAVEEPWKIMGQQWKIMGKSMGNYGNTIENHGNTR